jgi:pimeloyl-ACP methyl ester carboxylesterase
MGTPLLLSHGWPSSSIEYLKIIDLLTNPATPQEGAFDLVIPTIPGFGLSSPVSATGWQSVRTAKAYAELMQGLGYERYGAHGSDVGADILGELSKIDAQHLIGTHFASDTQTIVLAVAMFMGGGDPSQNPKLSDEQKAQVQQIQAEWENGGPYLKMQSTKPSTIGYGFQDSPIAQLAWQVEKYKEWTAPSDAVPEKKIDIDQMLTNISLYWFTGSGASSAQFIYENSHAQRSWGVPNEVPVGHAIFSAESFARLLLDPDQRINHWSEFAEGRHFPAMEVPALLASDIQQFFHECVG